MLAFVSGCHFITALCINLADHAVLTDVSATALEKCLQLRAMNIFGRIRGYIYHELLSKIYCPAFTRDLKVSDQCLLHSLLPCLF